MNAIPLSASVCVLIGLFLIAGVSADDIPIFEPMPEDMDPYSEEVSTYPYPEEAPTLGNLDTENAVDEQGEGDATVSQAANLKEHRIWEYSTARRVISSAITPDGTFIAVGTQRPGEVLLLDREGEIIWSHRYSSPVYSISISSDGSYTTVAADKLYVMYPHGGEAWAKDMEYYVYSTAVSSDGTAIVGGLDDGSVWCFDRNGVMRWQFQTGEDVYAVSTSSDGMNTAVGSDDGHIYMLDGYGGVVWDYKAHSPVRSIAISSDGSRIAAGTIDRTAYVFDKKGFLLWKYVAKNRVNSISVSPDGLFVAVAEGSRAHIFDQGGSTVLEYDANATSRVLVYSSTGDTYGPEVTSVALSSFGSFIVIGTGEGDPKVSLYSLLPSQQSVPFIPDSSLGSIYDLQPFFGQTTPYNGMLSDGYPYTYTITRKEEGNRNIYTIRMIASSPWVDAQTGFENVSIARATEEGEQEILPTAFSGYDLQGNYIFEAVTDKEITQYTLVFDNQDGAGSDAGQVSLQEIFIGVFSLISIGLFIFIVQHRGQKRLKRYEHLILNPVHGERAELEPEAWMEEGTKKDKREEPGSDFGKLESLIRGD